MVHKVLLIVELLSRGVLGVTPGVIIACFCVVYVTSLEPVPIILPTQGDMK